MYVMTSPPIELHWNGWVSDTHTLQNYGWAISIAQHANHAGFGLHVLLSHEESNVHGMSESLEINPMSYLRDVSYARSLNVKMTLARDFYVSTPINFAESYPADCRPAMRYVPETSRFRLSEFDVFERLKVPEHDLVISKASVGEILAFVLDKQEPTQEEIRQRLIDEKCRRSSTPIISINQAV